MIDQSLSLHERRTQILGQYFQAMDDLRMLKMEFAVNREHSPEEQIAYNNSLNDLKHKIQGFQFELTQVKFLMEQEKERQRRPKWHKSEDKFQDAQQKVDALRNRNR